MHIEALSNGMGSQSMALLILAAQKKIPATVSITADTGSENDCLLSDGRRVTALRFFYEVIRPYGDNHGIWTRFYRARNKNGGANAPMHLKVLHDKERLGTADPTLIPVFGRHRDTGKRVKLKQSCTDRYKIAAIRQQLRELGATSSRCAQGIHAGEVLRRAKGEPLENQPRDFFTLADTENKWQTHYYPLASLRMMREECEELCRQEGLLYVVRSQCEHCPLQDWKRWGDRTSESLAQSIALEASWGGRWFLTDRLKPLPQAIEEMKADHDARIVEYERKAAQLKELEQRATAKTNWETIYSARRNVESMQLELFGDLIDFGCENGVCGV